MTEKRESCADVRELIEQMVSVDISVPDLSAARDHLESCEACRDYHKALTADDAELAAYAASHAARIDAVRRRATAAVPDRRVVRPSGWRRLARSVPLRTALAASLAVVVFLAVFFGGGVESIDVWAEVYETVSRIASGRFRLVDRTGSGIESEQAYSERGLSHRSYEQGRLVESLHLDYDARMITYMMYPMQLAVRMEFDELTTQLYMDRTPDKLFEFLLENDHEDLGRKWIGSRRLQGVRVTDAPFMAERLDRAELELWVDPSDRLPVRLDVRGEIASGRNRRHVRFQDFEWNVELAQTEFAPEIPDHYEIHTGPRLRMDESSCLDGLRLFAEVTGDRYPTTLAYESLRSEMWRGLDPDRSQIGPLIVKMFRMRQACQFYGKLIEDEAEVVYFGHAVRPSDHQRVLMRWKVDEDRYRVIYGDLHTETVDGAELLRLES